MAATKTPDLTKDKGKQPAGAHSPEPTGGKDGAGASARPQAEETAWVDELLGQSVYSTILRNEEEVDEILRGLDLTAAASPLGQEDGDDLGLELDAESSASEGEAEDAEIGLDSLALSLNGPEGEAAGLPDDVSLVTEVLDLPLDAAAAEAAPSPPPPAQPVSAATPIPQPAPPVSTAPKPAVSDVSRTPAPLPSPPISLVTKRGERSIEAIELQALAKVFQNLAASLKSCMELREELLQKLKAVKSLTPKKERKARQGIDDFLQNEKNYNEILQKIFKDKRKLIKKLSKTNRLNDKEKIPHYKSAIVHYVGAITQIFIYSKNLVAAIHKVLGSLPTGDASANKIKQEILKVLAATIAPLDVIFERMNRAMGLLEKSFYLRDEGLRFRSNLDRAISPDFTRIRKGILSAANPQAGKVSSSTLVGHQTDPASSTSTAIPPSGENRPPNLAPATVATVADDRIEEPSLGKANAASLGTAPSTALPGGESAPARRSEVGREAEAAQPQSKAAIPLEGYFDAEKTYAATSKGGALDNIVVSWTARTKSAEHVVKGPDATPIMNAEQFAAIKNEIVSNTYEIMAESWDKDSSLRTSPQKVVIHHQLQQRDIETSSTLPAARQGASSRNIFAIDVNDASRLDVIYKSLAIALHSGYKYINLSMVAKTPVNFTRVPDLGFPKDFLAIPAVQGWTLQKLWAVTAQAFFPSMLSDGAHQAKGLQIRGVSNLFVGEQRELELAVNTLRAARGMTPLYSATDSAFVPKVPSSSAYRVDVASASHGG